MGMFEIAYIDSWKIPEDIKKERRECIELLKETIKSGDCKKALAASRALFRMSVAEAIACGILEDIVDVVNLWEEFCERKLLYERRKDCEKRGDENDVKNEQPKELPTIGYDLNWAEQIAPGIGFMLWLNVAKRMDLLFKLVESEEEGGGDGNEKTKDN